MQSILAVANEEGIVRIYNTESRDKPVLKGMCEDLGFFHKSSVMRTYQTNGG